ncbi:MAG: EI24 domain-containing protein [Synechocystis sp.]|nr:EI24 domain-containing protein [Synechocystis sp.]
MGIKDNLFGGWGFFKGLGYPLRTLTLLRQNPQWLPYIVIPLIINLVLGGLLYWQLWKFSNASIETLQFYGQQWIDPIRQQLPQIMPYILPVLKGGFWLIIGLWRLILLILTGFLLSQVGGVLGSPWYGQLSERLEKQVLGKLSIQDVGLLKEIHRAIAFELKKLVIIIGVGLVCVGLNLFPGLGTVLATAMGIITTATITCLDFFDPPLERRRLKFRQKLAIIAKSLPLSAGFGVTSLLWISIPLVNLVTIPLCVTAGTLFFCEEIYPRFFQAQET